MRTVATLVAAASLVVGLCGEEAFAQASQSKALQLQDLPASVQKTVQETLKAKPRQPLPYEAAYKDAKGQEARILVDADGKEVKD